MDLKKLFSITMIIGAVVLLLGVLIYISNQPKIFNQSESKKTVFGGNDDFGNYLNVQDENYSRKSKRGNAVVIIVIGGIVLLSGGVLNYSLKPSSNDSNLKNVDHERNQVGGFHYCTNCGIKLKYGEECSNCR